MRSSIPPCPGMILPESLHARGALHHRLGEVAERTSSAPSPIAIASGTESSPGEERARHERAHDAAHRAAGEALPGLLRRDSLEQLVPAERTCSVK